MYKIINLILPTLNRNSKNFKYVEVALKIYFFSEIIKIVPPIELHITTCALPLGCV